MRVIVYFTDANMRHSALMCYRILQYAIAVTAPIVITTFLTRRNNPSPTTIGAISLAIWLTST